MNLSKSVIVEGFVLNGSSIQILIAMVCYMAVVIGIGLFFAKKANKNS